MHRTESLYVLPIVVDLCKLSIYKSSKLLQHACHLKGFIKSFNLVYHTNNLKKFHLQAALLKKLFENYLKLFLYSHLLYCLFVWILFIFQSTVS